MRRFLTKVILLTLLVLILLAVFVPAVTAYLCPVCYGFTRAAPGLYIEAGYSADTALARRAEAEARVEAALGPLDLTTTLLVCRTAECDARLRNHGSKAVAYGAIVVHVSRHGLATETLTHELVHVGVNRRLGPIWQVLGHMPVWWDEGLATLVASGRPANCAGSGAELPVTTLEWRLASERENLALYRRAACRVSDWLADHGGYAGAVEMVNGMRLGRPFTP